MSDAYTINTIKESLADKTGELLSVKALVSNKFYKKGELFLVERTTERQLEVHYRFSVFSDREEIIEERMKARSEA